jgi:hypothetical protein
MGTPNGFVDICCHGTSSMIQFEWFIYGAMAGLVAPYIWPLISRCIEEARIARRDWRKSDEHH